LKKAKEKNISHRVAEIAEKAFIFVENKENPLWPLRL
jgi:hypothetical protein